MRAAALQTDPERKKATGAARVRVARRVTVCLSRVKGNLPARLCVQERLVCSAGVSPAGVTIGSPVAGRAGRRETECPEAPRRPHPRDGRESPGRNDSEREVAPRVSSPGGRARNREGEGSMARRRPIDAADRSGGVVSDGTAARTHRATGEALLVPTGNGGSWVGSITGSTGKWADDERVTDGPVVAAKRGNARGAKGPCCSAIPPPTREAGVR